MTYIAILDSILAKLTEEEKKNLQDSLDSHLRVGHFEGYDSGYAEGYLDGLERGYEDGIGDGH